ncbi:SIS domain-containing protein [Sulfitobacter sp. D35]|uniref:SIS domain-containing protein n=1 Tax=Sulfitobacter sp. D35 TaxID=3083252 RepID=UPI00296F1BAB|nr:SIS domain-containing protein [Sulfitobacter sp. D35]MDW4500032.1 SIS domain-containing protein [Sulfitobacter sp. D35]
MTETSFARHALAEIGQVMDRMSDEAVAEACAEIAQARRVMLYGCGREGLMMRGFAMRLYHLGLDVSVQGDMAAPPLGPGDLLVASAGPGELGTVTSLMRTARNAGADVMLLTAVPDTPAAKHGSRVLNIPAQTMATDARGASRLPMGSVYEGALFILFETMVAQLADRLGANADTMRSRHTNME